MYIIKVLPNDHEIARFDLERTRVKIMGNKFPDRIQIRKRNEELTDLRPFFSQHSYKQIIVFYCETDNRSLRKNKTYGFTHSNYIHLIIYDRFSFKSYQIYYMQQKADVKSIINIFPRRKSR